jgi:hypothetical protein
MLHRLKADVVLDFSERVMSKGDGWGLTVIFGWQGGPVSGEKRRSLKQATDIDAHLRQNAVVGKARARAERIKPRRKLRTKRPSNCLRQRANLSR